MPVWQASWHICDRLHGLWAGDWAAGFWGQIRSGSAAKNISLTGSINGKSIWRIAEAGEAYKYKSFKMLTSLNRLLNFKSSCLFI